MLNYHPKLIQKAVLAYYLNNVTETIKHRDIPFAKLYNLVPTNQSFDKREAAIREGKKEKVNFNGMVKKLMKSGISDYPSVIAYGDRLHFAKGLLDKVQLIIEFEKIHQWGLGKTFTINLLVNVSVDDKRKIEIGKNLFNYLGSLERFHWTYITAEELERILVEVTSLLNKVLPFLESFPTSDIVRIYESCPEFIPFRGSMTARQGIEEATTLAKGWASDAVLKKITSFADLDLRDELSCSGVGIDGISRSHGSWEYMYSSEKGNKSMWVSIPFLGIHSLRVFNTPISFTFKSLETDWIDSNKVGLLASSHLQGETEAMDKTTIHANFDLEYDPSRYNLNFPIWRVHYVVGLFRSQSQDRRDWLLTIDARDGKVVEEKYS